MFNFSYFAEIDQNTAKKTIFWTKQKIFFQKIHLTLKLMNQKMSEIIQIYVPILFYLNPKLTNILQKIFGFLLFYTNEIHEF